MTGDPFNDVDLRTLWRDQPAEHDPMTLAQIHQQAETFERKVRRRNLRDYVGTALVILFFAPLLFAHSSWMMQAGAAMIIVAALTAARHLHKVASARVVPDVGATIVDFRREELIRQRDALRSIGRWYLAPFLPGLVLLMAGRWFQSHVPGRSIEADHLAILAASAFAAIVFGVVWALNQRGARRLQKQIDALESR